MNGNRQPDAQNNTDNGAHWEEMQMKGRYAVSRHQYTFETQF
jgi:hypothetical protein